MRRFFGGLFFALIIFSSCLVKNRTSGLEEDLKYPGSLDVVARDAWGWKALSHSSLTHQINKITIHHGGVDFPEDRDPVAYLQNLQDWSRAEKNWIDIPYHYMVDLEGRVYEARPLAYPGDTNTTYDPRGHALICVMGNYQNQTIKEGQLQAVIELAALFAKEFAVDIDAIRGHKDYTDTLCPGKDLYRYVRDGTIRRATRRVMRAEGPNLQITPSTP